MKNIVYWIEGDGIGPEIWRAARPVLDAAVFKCYAGERTLEWVELLAGAKALKESGELLPEGTLAALRKADLIIKGPLSTPQGSTSRDINVRIQQETGMYARIHPIRHHSGLACPIKRPELIDMIIFSAIGTSNEHPERLLSMAINQALKHGLPSVTFVHEATMQAGEPGLQTWWPGIAGDKANVEVSLEKDHLTGTMILKECSANEVFMNILTHPELYRAIVAQGACGEYLSSLLVSAVGGHAMDAEINISDSAAMFSTRQAPAEWLAGKNQANPGGLIMCGAMLLEHIGWPEASNAIFSAVQNVIESETLTADLADYVPGADIVGCAEFAERIIQEL